MSFQELQNLDKPWIQTGSKYGMIQYAFVPPRVSKQGWTVTWKHNSTNNTFQTCKLCLGTRFVHRTNSFGKVETVPCFTCHGRGIKFYEKPEDMGDRR